MPDWKTIETLAEIPRFHARRTPERTALVFGERRTTFAALEKRCAEAAAALSAEGVRPGDRVAWLDLNSDFTYEMLFACARMGAVFCPLNWRLSVSEIRDILDDADARILFVGARFFDVAEKLALPGPKKIVSIDGERAGWEAYPDWRSRRGAGTVDGDGSPGAPAIQIYTSGTTGRPKGVVLSNSALLATGKENAGEMAWNDWGPDDVSLLTMPCFHIAGLRWGVMGLAPGALPTTVERPFKRVNCARARVRPTCSPCARRSATSAARNWRSPGSTPPLPPRPRPCIRCCRRRCAPACTCAWRIRTGSSSTAAS